MHLIPGIYPYGVILLTLDHFCVPTINFYTPDESRSYYVWRGESVRSLLQHSDADFVGLCGVKKLHTPGSYLPLPCGK